LPAQLPTGTVTFLFTDIEGSTRLWDAFPDDMRVALSIHDRIVTDAVTRNGGHVVKNTGDGIFAAFDSAVSAVAAAAQSQREIVDEPWPDVVGALGVRMALHTAGIDPVDGDYHGPDVNRVARIEAAAHGGQILMSTSTHSLVANDLAAGWGITDLGVHLLRGLSEPEHIRQLAVPGLRASFPPLRTSSALAARLPTPPTSFVGRRSELDELVATLTDPAARLITLLGPGGIGKTRLSIEAARLVSEREGIPAHFFPLEGIRTTSDVVKALGDSIGFVFDIHISGQIPEKTQLFDRLRAQPLLLVLDNLEHLDDIADLVREMLERIPTLTVVATSRRQLDLSAEWRHEVRGLADGEIDDAIELFVDRATRAGADVDLAGPDRQTISALCEQLGGMPLAIELAAAWAGMLSPEEIAAEIGKGLELLEASTRDTPDRHRSVRTVFDHSWGRLDEDLREAYARLSVFEAPFDREAAAAVAGATLPVLMRLAKQSLITRSAPDRHALHPLLRQLASEHLGDQRDEVDDRYARYFLTFLLDRERALGGSLDMMSVRDEIAEQLGHLRAVSDRWIDRFPDADVLTMLEALNDFYFVHSWVDGVSHFERLVARLEERVIEGGEVTTAYLWAQLFLNTHRVSFETPDELAAALDPIEEPIRRIGGGILARWLVEKAIELTLRNDYEGSIPLFEQAMELQPDGRGEYDTALYAWFGWAHLQLGHLDEATAIFDRGLELTIEAHHTLGQAFLLSKSGLAADSAGDHDRALQLHHEGREIFVKAGDLGGQGYTLSRLSWTNYLLGDYDQARRYALEGLARFEEINHRWGIAVSYGRLGLAEIEMGRLAEAADHFLACLDQATAGGLVEQQHYAVTGIGRALAKSERWSDALAILREEARAEQNPYKEFAEKGLELMPEQTAAGVASEELGFDELLVRARRSAEELAQSAGSA
jgi:class 3 adenylate cyclase/tetratricopeptide (TPR) repeat protein